MDAYALISFESPWSRPTSQLESDRSKGWTPFVARWVVFWPLTCSPLVIAIYVSDLFYPVISVLFAWIFGCAQIMAIGGFLDDHSCTRAELNGVRQALKAREEILRVFTIHQNAFRMADLITHIQTCPRHRSVSISMWLTRENIIEQIEILTDEGWLEILDHHTHKLEDVVVRRRGVPLQPTSRRPDFWAELPVDVTPWPVVPSP